MEAVILLVEAYDKHSDAFIGEVDVTAIKSFLNQIIVPRDNDVEYCNPVEIGYEQFIEIKQHFPEIEKYREYDLFLQGRTVE